MTKHLPDVCAHCTLSHLQCWGKKVGGGDSLFLFSITSFTTLTRRTLILLTAGMYRMTVSAESKEKSTPLDYGCVWFSAVSRPRLLSLAVIQGWPRSPQVTELSTVRHSSNTSLFNAVYFPSYVTVGVCMWAGVCLLVRGGGWR